MKNEPYVHVHICNLAAQTGVTRYTQIHDRWTYSKNESLQPEQLQEYTHLLIEAKSKYSPTLKYFTQTHVILDSVESFSQIAMNYKLMPPIRIKTKPALFILERIDFREYPHGYSFIDSKSKESIPQISEETIVEEIDYENIKEETILEESKEAINVESVKLDRKEELKQEVPNVEIIEEKIEPKDEIEFRNLKEAENESISQENIERPKLSKAKKAIEDLKTLRQERKKKAIEKIKLETRKEVVASAKEKLKEIMKRHKHIADELSNSIISDVTLELEEKDDRGDIPDMEIIVPENNNAPETESQNKEIPEPVIDNALTDGPTTTFKNENVDSIVDEVIVRLIDRKIYDDKTKPEDIKAEDRLMIQKIVEEVLSERMNYSNVDIK